MGEETQSFSIKKRKLTFFLCQEMLYDYVSNKLDSERKRAVTEFLGESKEIQNELVALNKGLAYVEQLAQVHASEPLVEKIKNARSPLTQWLRKYHWEHWPEFTKWTIEAVAVSVVVVATAIILTPKIIEWWPQATHQKVLLVEVDRNAIEGEDIAPDTEESLPAVAKVEDVKAEPPKAEPSKIEPATTSSAPAPAQEEPEEKSVEVAATTKAAVQEDEEISETKPSTKKADKPLKGFLYRAFMELDNLDVLTDRISADIEKLGGEKAGEVPLGWKKPDGSYYHFSMPDANYDELVTILKNYGEVRIYKDPHPRVMPEGVIRLILWIEDASLKK